MCFVRRLRQAVVSEGLAAQPLGARRSFRKVIRPMSARKAATECAERGALACGSPHTPVRRHRPPEISMCVALPSCISLRRLAKGACSHPERYSG